MPAKTRGDESRVAPLVPLQIHRFFFGVRSTTLQMAFLVPYSTGEQGPSCFPSGLASPTGDFSTLRVGATASKKRIPHQQIPLEAQTSNGALFSFLGKRVP